MSAENSDTPDAVCFSSGIPTAAFGAGCIHAYLASGRKHPLVVAGISLGAVNAAAMQRCYREIRRVESQTEDPRACEAARWTWFRKYLTTIVSEPFDFMWNSIPNPSDALAELPPPVDWSVPEGKEWTEAERRARRSFYLKVKLGAWFARLNVKVSLVAEFLVALVRWRERYTAWPIRFYRLASRFLRLFWGVLTHVCFCPQFFPEYKFARRGEKGFRRSLLCWRPLLGWSIYLLAWAILIAPAAAFLWLLIHELHTRFGIAPSKLPQVEGLLIGITLVLEFLYFSVIFGVHSWWQRISDQLSRDGNPAGRRERLAGLIRDMVRVWQKRGTMGMLWAWLLEELFSQVHLHLALLDDFHLRRKLFELFKDEMGESPAVSDEPMPALLVAAPLQILPDAQGFPQPPIQLWARKGITVVEALRTALSVPGIFEPIRKTGEAKATWISRKRSEHNHALDLVDGAVVRHNPLPALFQFLRRHRDVRRELEFDFSNPGGNANVGREGRHQARVHLIYGVPVRSKDASTADSKNGAAPDVVTAIVGGLRLARRRDSRLEVWRTNRISQLECQIEQRAGVFPIFVDEIAPDEELIHENPLKPNEQEILRHIAAGCRKTLSVLYRDELPPLGCRSCQELLPKLTGTRRFWDEPATSAPGLAEICVHCTKVLRRPDDPPGEFAPAFSAPVEGRTPAQRFPHLTGEEPRIVFCASGGVFRGAFHIGMLAALVNQHIRPDMIVGASVGTLIGAALGAMYLQSSYEGALRVLSRLTATFVDVDQAVTLTKTLKTAARDLGQRGKSVSLSPSQFRSRVLRGSEADPGFAATGAPPAFIDAISNLFLIPHRSTADITAKFVGGHIEEAVRDFLVHLRKETIVRLGIQKAIIGDSLLELAARKIFGPFPANEAQPFHRPGPGGNNPEIAFFATAVNLTSELVTIVGAETGRQHKSYDFLQSMLASSAFPGIFAPIRESDIYSGLGHTDVYFGDGGMFDNLPFAPACELLGKVQADFRTRRNKDDSLTSSRFLRERAAAPDLFMVGSLAARQNSHADFGNVFAIWERGLSLGDNEKIDNFKMFLEITDGQIQRFLEKPRRAEDLDHDLLDGVVNAAMLPVFPSSSEHLNGTFHCCRALKLKDQDVQRSIADGCFQTLVSLAKAQTVQPETLLGKSIKGLQDRHRLPRILADTKSDCPSGCCPFFTSSAQAAADFTRREVTESSGPERFKCPFHTAAARAEDGEKKHVEAIHAICLKDEEHWKVVRQAC